MRSRPLAVGLTVFAAGCVSMRPAADAALHALEVVAISRAESFALHVRHDVRTNRHEVCEVHSVTGRVLRANADTVFLSRILWADAATFGDDACLQVVPGYVVLDHASPPVVSVSRFDGQKTIKAAFVVVVAAMLFFAFVFPTMSLSAA